MSQRKPPSRKLALAGAASIALLTACGGAEQQGTRAATTTTRSAGDATPPAVARTKPRILPTGAAVQVRTVEPLSSDGASAGTPFEAAVASAIRDTDGAMLAAEGAKVYGRVLEAQSRRGAMEPRLTIGLTAIEAFAGKAVRVAARPADARSAAPDGGDEIELRPGTVVEFIVTEPARMR